MKGHYPIINLAKNTFGNWLLHSQMAKLIVKSHCIRVFMDETLTSHEREEINLIFKK